MKQYFVTCKNISGILVALFLLTPYCFKPTFGQDQEICDKIAREVELRRNLPKNILTSIALVEAGRKHIDGSVKPWPWSLNHAGKSLFFEKKADALVYLKNNISEEFKNIDVGCMQINVKWHKQHFDSFASMIDPYKNIEYAATFLTELKRIKGSWKDAIKHYHSSTPKLHQKYYAKVEKVWSKKIRDKVGTKKAALYLDENITYSDKSMNEEIMFSTNVKKNLDGNEEEMLKFIKYKGIDQDNQIYLNAVLIENDKMYDKGELKRYIKYKSSYLAKNIDMILLFREEFSEN